ncbi:hypothetical protein TW65_01035 [Stemphylium lycopersici]|uniref:RING-type domain-containing protein n=1 Tax=Stemphylium lycopersici TaxID=183478 RepID=A0A364MWT8_STELY|nr:hypothetical protein TW65_01035 [Stemphylium lycopersici]RAR05765.1 hypothetical protein DDE83_007225 [Stemphylium lycopersici]
MSDQPEDCIVPGSHAPASTEVYYQVRQRIRNLGEMRKFRQGHDRLDDVLDITPGDLRKFEQLQHGSSSSHTRINNMSDEEIKAEATAARNWLLGMLDFQDKVMLRENEMRLFRFAVEKQMSGQKNNYTEKERLYMALTSTKTTSSFERLRAAFLVVFHLNLAGHLKDVTDLAIVRAERLQSSADAEAERIYALESIVQKSASITVDYFACAVPLSLLTSTANSTSVVDDNAGCCPICQNSYTAFAEFPIKDLLADYPVRIKHCGHIVGKACLEQWMVTPKINEAKYPHRTCPLCRVKVEGVEGPAVPHGLRKHLKKDRRSLESLHELAYGYDVTLEECIVTIVACMSKEIACTELLSEVQRNGGDEKQEDTLRKMLTELQKEKRLWGFRGNVVGIGAGNGDDLHSSKQARFGQWPSAGGSTMNIRTHHEINIPTCFINRIVPELAGAVTSSRGVSIKDRPVS